MAWYEAGGLMIGMILLLMGLGLPVAFAFLTANIVGVYVFMGGAVGITQLVDNLTSLVTNFTLVPVPLFVLMGSLFFHTGLAVRVFDALEACFGRLPGRLSYITVAGGATFATLTGSSGANTAMLGSLMVPEMTRRGYKKHMSMGPVLGSGGLAMIIPPSTMAIILGTIAQLDIGAILIAGLLPGLVLAILYGSAIWLQVRIDPAAAPAYDVAPVPLSAALRLVATNILPMGLVVFCVVGFILLGVATPSEAAAFGVLGVMVLAAAFRCMTMRALRKSLFATVRVAGMAFLIVMGSSTFSEILAFSGASSALIAWTTGLDAAPLAMLLIMFATLLFLGMLMDGLSVLLLTVPIFFPLIGAIGYDPIWFGIIMLLAVEMSLTTPPFGLLLFIMLGVAPAGTRMAEVVRAALPYLACDAILVTLLIAFPSLALYLPRLMN